MQKYNVVSKRTRNNRITGKEIPVETFTGPYTVIGHDANNFYVVHGNNGNFEDTQDRFFLLSKDEVCGGYPAFKTERDRIKTDLNGETDWHRLRSAYRGNAHYTWCVNASGDVYGSHAINAFRFAPTCVIA